MLVIGGEALARRRLQRRRHHVHLLPLRSPISAHAIRVPLPVHVQVRVQVGLGEGPADVHGVGEGRDERRERLARLRAEADHRRHRLVAALRAPADVRRRVRELAVELPEGEHEVADEDRGYPASSAGRQEMKWVTDRRRESKLTDRKRAAGSCPHLRHWGGPTAAHEVREKHLGGRSTDGRLTVAVWKTRSMVYKLARNL